MRPTNYHLFDFMDFDTDLKRDESLWKAYKPTSVREKDGDILGDAADERSCETVAAESGVRG